MISLIQDFEADFLWKVSLKILNSVIILKNFTHADKELSICTGTPKHLKFPKFILKLKQRGSFWTTHLTRRMRWLLNSFCKWRHLLSVGNLYKQFGPRSGPTKCRSWSGSKLFDTLIVFLKQFFEKVNLEKVSRGEQKHEELCTSHLYPLLPHLRGWWGIVTFHFSEPWYKFHPVGTCWW